MPNADFTTKQGQYLAYIHLYTRLHRAAPAETDFRFYFGTTAPSIHQMIVTLHKKGFISRTPRTSRSIRLLIPTDQIPELLPIQSIRTSASQN